MERQKIINIKITKSNHKLLTNDCIKTFIREYPDMDIKDLTINFIFERVCLYYNDRIKEPFTKNNDDK